MNGIKNGIKSKFSAAFIFLSIIDDYLINKIIFYTNKYIILVGSLNNFSNLGIYDEIIIFYFMIDHGH